MIFENIFGLTRKIDNLQSGDTLEIEKIKLKIEWYKTRGTIFSIFIPLFAGVVAFVGQIWLEHERSDTNFQIKAIEIVMTAENPDIAVNKAIVISELFPERIPKNFPEKMKRMYAK